MGPACPDYYRLYQGNNLTAHIGKDNTRKMQSVQNGTTENVSAKKAARRGKLWIFPVVLLLCVLAAALGGFLIYRFYTPSEYTESEVNEYVSSIYGDS